LDDSTHEVAKREVEEGRTQIMQDLAHVQSSRTLLVADCINKVGWLLMTDFRLLTDLEMWIEVF
jgi:hypothetical protein